MTIKISNIESYIDKGQVHNLLSKYGKVVSIELKARTSYTSDFDVYSPGVESVKVNMSTLEEENYVIEKLNGSEWLGQKIVVEKSVPRIDNDIADERLNVLEIIIETPEDASPERIKEIIKEAALRADMTHRSFGGNGLTIKAVEVIAESKVLQSSGE